MKVTLLFLFLLVVSALAVPLSDDLEKKKKKKKESCTADNCKLPNCRCASTEAPKNVPIDKIPQFVFLTFDDAVRADNYAYYKEAFYGKKNPDGCPVSSTMFVSHEYTDYSKVHDLYINGQEIALHSITHSALTTYWQTISADDFRDEFDGERTLISHFANIPDNSITGHRIPFLQLSGNVSFETAKEIGLTYDCSWPTQSFTDPGLWPYTLDFHSKQDCPIGPCPTAPIPGMWVVPMLDWKDLQNLPCAMVDSCQHIPTKEEEILDWYKTNFNRNYKSNKAPFGFYVHAAWFSLVESHFKAYVKFIDYLLTLPDVYLVGINRGIEWIKNPVPIGDSKWPACPEIVPSDCTPQACPLDKDGQERYMTVCGDCPNVYPWIRNPLGE